MRSASSSAQRQAAFSRSCRPILRQPDHVGRSSLRSSRSGETTPRLRQACRWTNPPYPYGDTPTEGQENAPRPARLLGTAGGEEGWPRGRVASAPLDPSFANAYDEQATSSFGISF